MMTLKQDIRETTVKVYDWRMIKSSSYTTLTVSYDTLRAPVHS